MRKRPAGRVNREWVILRKPWGAPVLRLDLDPELATSLDEIEL
jgi:hypothetical protein